MVEISTTPELLFAIVFSQTPCTVEGHRHPVCRPERAAIWFVGKRALDKRALGRGALGGRVRDVGRGGGWRGSSDAGVMVLLLVSGG